MKKAILEFFCITKPRPIFLWLLSIVIIGTTLWIVFEKYSEWQAIALQISPSSDRLKAENANLTVVAQICGGLALLIGLCFTGWNARIAQKNMAIAQRNMEIAEDGKITDRMSKAVEQLASDKLAIRLGGIYALERIAKDSERDHPQVIEVLTAFIRENSPIKESTSVEEGLIPIGTDIQAILTVICLRDKTDDIDLRRANLSKAYLSEAILSEAILSEAILSGADLSGANLFEANLSGANLFEADLSGADLENVRNLTIDQLSTVNSLYRVKNLDSTLLNQVKEKLPDLLNR